ncbi:hypothetical protein [Faecalibacterium sp. DFI.5.82]|jgi:hypothetical protein|uniref:hypothetical protein n=1 Tax=Faecalibacterium sp. DFI.5.82 TaxID=3031725 RepID=UPI0023B03EFA|nr:hypothetical protein [Faecalibacterium sp. DFI.5.82]MDE8689982.1 hypothetical protein [Faecalibacterium sp. DFI.5.82]
MKKQKPILFAIVILILLLFIIGGMLGLLPQPLFVLSSQTILVILVCGGALIIGLLLKFFRREVRFLGVSMLPFFNQKELVVCSNQSQYQKYTSLLEKAGITYRTKARDLSSPSLFSMGTRERAGTAFQKVNYQTLYTIYVRKADYERAVHVILA